MKNVHLTPTPQPSRLYYSFNNSELQLSKNTVSFRTFERSTQNIYITNDEEIKLNDYVIQINSEKTNTKVIKCIDDFQVKIANDKYGSFTKKKIILTTDQDLIGVQTIDDEFLEWFVKNPSCEEVDIDAHVHSTEKGHILYYQIIIPKEKVLLQSSIDGNPVWGEPIQETLEEYAKKEAIKQYSEDAFGNLIVRKSIEKGAKWKQERSYSEEEVLELLLKSKIETSNLYYEGMKEWFEQIKKK